MEGKALVILQEEVGDEYFKKIEDFIIELVGYARDYRPIVDNEWFERMKFCGCGDTDVAEKYIQDVLEKMDSEIKNEAYVEQLQAALKSSPEGAAYFVLYALDAMGLTEHGSSVWSSCLTDKGKEMLRALKGLLHEHH